jgi:LPS export ABC transporter protein LptC
MKGIVGVLIYVLCMSCENDLNKVRSFSGQEEVNADVVDNISMVYYEEGQRRAVIISPELRKQFKPEPKMTFPKGTQIFFYNNGKESCRLKADFAENNPQLKELKVIGNVHISNDKGESLSCEEMTWKEQEKIILAKGAVILNTEKERIKGYNFYSDETFTNYTLQKITGIFSIKEK